MERPFRVGTENERMMMLYELCPICRQDDGPEPSNHGCRWREVVEVGITAKQLERLHKDALAGKELLKAAKEVCESDENEAWDRLEAAIAAMEGR